VATTNIALDVQNITGVVTANAQFLLSAQKYVVSSVPKELLWFAAARSDAITAATGYDVQGSDTVLAVEREGYPAIEVPFSMSKWISDSTSLHKATNLFPRYYLSQGKVFIKPDPAAGGANDGYVDYIDYAQIDDDCDLRNVVVFHACSSEFSKLATDLAPTWTSPVLPVTPTTPSFGSDLSITATAPTIPVLLTNSVDESGLTAPTFTPPVMSPPDWSGIDTLITSEEDAGMVVARSQAVQMKIGEYSAKLQEAQTSFEKENTEYKAKLQIAIQNTQLDNSEETIKIQKYGAELNKYQQDISKEVQNFVNTLTKEVQEYQSKIAVYSAELQSYQLVLGEQTASKAITQKNISYYEQQSDRYYKMAQAGIQQYVQNNSKIINKTIAAQAAQQGSR
jgi:hypothetical protein